MARRGLFASFLQGGFEGATHRRADGQRVDVIAASRHDQRAAEDYALLRHGGLATVRDALRWHRIETQPGRYDWSSFLPMLRAADAAGVQVIWDLCHYGVPDAIDPWAADFPARFAAFAAAAARLVRDETAAAPFYSLINEISYWAWAGGETGWIHPYGIGRGAALKRQLVRAVIAATWAVRAIEPRARFLQPEPAIHIAADPHRPWEAALAEGYRQAQFEAFDLLAGRLEPELGGEESLLDLIGCNFYWNNQWIHEGPTLGLGHPSYRPLSAILAELQQRYGRPIVVSETSAEGESALAWISHVAAEVCRALDGGVAVHGLCLYPVMDYPGWDDGRHCSCGLIAASAQFQGRSLRADVGLLLEAEGRRCARAVADAAARGGYDAASASASSVAFA